LLEFFVFLTLLYFASKEMLLKKLFREFKKGGKEMQGNKLYVGNLNYAVNEDQLKELFENHGTVQSVNIIEGKGFGFVEMSTNEEAEAAKAALNDQEFHGRPLKIDEARPRKPRRDFDSEPRRHY
jgi:RNA recognition motif-containing protein